MSSQNPGTVLIVFQLKQCFNSVTTAVSSFKQQAIKCYLVIIMVHEKEKTNAMNDNQFSILLIGKIVQSKMWKKKMKNSGKFLDLKRSFLVI